MQINIIGLDLAKSVFQVHGVQADGGVLRKKLRRAQVLPFFESQPPSLVGMEACATAHHWAREITALGHEVRLMPPAYVKAYLRRQKNDAADAEAICEAVTRPTMRFVPVKSAERQGVLVLHRTRELLVRQRTMLINAIRGHCVEFGLIAPQGPRRVMELIAQVQGGSVTALPEIARAALLLIGDQLAGLALQIQRLERRLLAWHRQDRASQRLASIPGVGLITATALAASVTDPSLFRSGREFASFLGLVPRQNSSGGKDKLGRISKKGDGYLEIGMLVVETVVRIRREHAAGKAIKAISRDLRLSRKVVRKAIRAEEGAFSYQRTAQPFPKIGPVRERLEQLLAENEARPRRDRLKLTRVWDLLVREGYDGSYCSVRRYAARWREQIKAAPGDGGTAFVPLMFAPGEAFQFDFSHEDVEIAGQPMRVKVAHVRLCASRAIYLRAYPRETQEMVFDAHQRAFAFFGGVPMRGIYDNMKTAVDAVFRGKERVFNRRFLLMADHYMFEPTACPPASGWEKGQVENQVKISRDRFFKPRLRFTSLEELNGWLEAECLRWASQHPHPEQGEITLAQALETERPALQPILALFDGFHEVDHAVTGTCLIAFDRNRYSVMAKAAKRTVQVRAYADRIVVRCAGEVVAEHARSFGRGCTIYDPWHYLPVLARKPGALRNGAPFQDWSLPPALTQLKRKLGRGDEADRRFVRVLAAVLIDGLDAVDDAVREALDAGVASDEVILNILARRREPPAPAPITTSDALALRHPPVADCARYDLLRGPRAAA